MRILRTVLRIVLGLLFAIVGVAGFIPGKPQGMPGMAGTLLLDFYQSHWAYAISFAQLVAGVLLLVNRWVPVAVIVLAAFLYNSLAFHLFTTPALLPMPILVLIVVCVVAWPYRSDFARLFASKGE
jgi:putative oxidoreductase